MDLLTEIPDTTITITQQPTDTVISVPKRGECITVNLEVEFKSALDLSLKRIYLPAETVNHRNLILF